MATDTSKLTEKAKLSAEKQLYDIAIDYYLQALDLVPNDVQARKELRLAQQRNRQIHGIPKSTALFKGLPILAKVVAGSFSMKDPERLMRECEQYLCLDPLNNFVNMKLGLAALAAGHNDMAIWVFEFLSKIKTPPNPEHLRYLGRSYEASGRRKEAQDTYHQLKTLKSNDKEASDKVRDLAAAMMTERIENADVATKGTRAVLKSKEDTEKYERADKYLRTEEEIRQAIADAIEEAAARPADPRLPAKVGDLYLQVNDFDKAAEFYNKAREISPTDNTFIMKLGNVEIKKFDVAIRQAQEELKAHPGDENIKQKIRKLMGDSVAYKLKEYERRVKVHPTELGYRFDLGNLYMATKQYDKAVESFQVSQREASRRPASLYRLGLAFAAKNDLEFATKSLEECLKSIQPGLLEDLRKECRYALGDVSERLADKTQDPEQRKNLILKARESFSKIYEADITFKDIAKRMETIRSKQ